MINFTEITQRHEKNIVNIRLNTTKKESLLSKELRITEKIVNLVHMEIMMD